MSRPKRKGIGYVYDWDKSRQKKNEKLAILLEKLRTCLHFTFFRLWIDHRSTLMVHGLFIQNLWETSQFIEQRHQFKWTYPIGRNDRWILDFILFIVSLFFVARMS